jgi:hypothetical protein
VLGSQNSGSDFSLNSGGDTSVFGVNQLPDIFGGVKAKLRQAATNAEIFTDAFGDKANTVELQTVITQLAIGDFSQLPNIQVISAVNMNGINGGYDKITNHIYLSADLFSSNASPIDSILGAAGVLTEEIGHFLDRFGKDTRGDEDEIFKNSVFEYVLNATELKYIHQEDDRAFIRVGDELVECQASITG